MTTRTGTQVPATPRLAPATAGGADTATVEDLFRSVYPKLAGWARRQVDDDGTAHEIASEAFVRLLSRWTKVDSPKSYLYMVASNLVRDHWRRAEREQRAILSVTAEPAAGPATDPAR